jgi:hypothetical protein
MERKEQPWRSNGASVESPAQRTVYVSAVTAVRGHESGRSSEGRRGYFGGSSTILGGSRTILGGSWTILGGSRTIPSRVADDTLEGRGRYPGGSSTILGGSRTILGRGQSAMKRALGWPAIATHWAGRR